MIEPDVGVERELFSCPDIWGHLLEEPLSLLSNRRRRVGRCGRRGADGLPFRDLRQAGANSAKAAAMIGSVRIDPPNISMSID
jgi:hypothetical protein